MTGKTLAITGASSGIGRHFAEVLSAAGGQLLLGARRTEMIMQLAGELHEKHGVKVLAKHLDVTSRESLAAFLQAGFDAFGHMDVLINNAGVESGAKTYTMISEEDWDRVLDTNLKAAWLGSKLYTEKVAEDRSRTGNIINVASITAFRTIKGQFPYAVSKAALVKATEIMALEGAKFGVRVNALAPGYILTDVSRLLLESARGADFVKSIPMRRYGEFSDLSGPLLLLASDASSYMTGSCIVVDGGHLCAELG